ncbi:MAG: 2'-deoxycytidine 5'-triphosphate deaminase, partial [Deltaproteobacteria bacterium]|nr:2'-deoxycytidine 5'-triphosphate deaminase [Deltaproteobacteria bacterium]
MAIKKNGVFSLQELTAAVSSGVIKAKRPIEAGQIQPASMDLRLGAKAYRLVSSFLPEDSTVLDRLRTKDSYGSDLVMYEVDISEGAILEKGSVYLIPLMEELKLPKGVEGKANPKSTIGRLDIFTRVIADKNPRFDEISSGYKGQLFVEVMPRSFAIKVKEGLSLVQLRLRRGKCMLDDKQLKALNNKERLLYDGKKNLKNSDVLISNGMFMSVDLVGDKGSPIIGYKSKKNSHVVDLTKRDHYRIEDFWEPLKRNK